jgi:hypothetical protein
VGTIVDIRGIMMLPEGLTVSNIMRFACSIDPGWQAQGVLRQSSKPEGDREGDLESYGLAVFGNKGELKFCQEWSNLRIDQWLREHLPEPFIYLDTKYPAPGEQRHWRLLKPSHNKLRLHRNIAGGYDFNEAKGSRGRSWSDCKIYIGK